MAHRRARAGKIIGVLGCVAQQEGEEIFERAPWVSLVCGSASYQKLPELMDELEAGGRRVTGLDLDTDETFETEITRRDNPFRAYITIIEGCDYACSYCVVPHTRGPERSRPSDAVLAEARRLADAGYTEIQLLGQTVNSYRDPSPRGSGISSDLLRAVAEVPGIRRVRFTTSHPNDFTREIVEAIDEIPALCDHIHLPGAIGLHAHSSRHAPHLHARGVSRKNFLDSRRRAAPSASPATSSSASPARRSRISKTRSPCSMPLDYDGVFAFKYSPRPNTSAAAHARRRPRRREEPPPRRLQERQRQIQTARNEKLIGQTFEMLVDGLSRRARPVGRPHYQQPRPKFHFAASRIFWDNTCRCESRAPGRTVSWASRSPVTGGSREATMELEVKIRGLMMDPVTNMPVVVLKEAQGTGILPIWVGIYEANAIALEIEKVQTPRPMTHDLLKNVLTGLNVHVQKVVVSDLKDDTFYALIWMEREGQIMSMDSRPSDALALALRLDCPIFVEDQVLKNSKMASVVSEKSSNEELRKWLENLNDEDLGRYKM